MRRNPPINKLRRDCDRMEGTKRAVWTVQRLDHDGDAARISDFLLSPDGFDDRRFTPGELEHLSNHPTDSLSRADYEYLFVSDSEGRVLGVVSFFENEQRSGGYNMDYLVVRKQARKLGIASLLIERMMELVRERGGRYIVTYTCDIEAYLPVKQLFTTHGFRLIGVYPDYYFQGEARLSYYRAL